MADENVDEATARIPTVKEQWAIQTKTKQRLRPPVNNGGKRNVHEGRKCRRIIVPYADLYEIEVELLIF